MIDFLLSLIFNPGFLVILIIGFAVAGISHYLFPGLAPSILALVTIITWVGSFLIHAEYYKRND